MPNKSKNVDHMNGADLACIVYSSVPADRSVWLKTDKAGNNINITSDKHITRSNTSGPVKELVLQIRNATEQDAGMYTCRAQFGAVVKEDTLQLTVTGNKDDNVKILLIQVFINFIFILYEEILYQIRTLWPSTHLFLSRSH